MHRSTRWPRARGNFYARSGPNFDLTFAEFSDRDAAFKQYQYGDGGASWFNAADFHRHARFMGTVVTRGAEAAGACGRSRSATPRCGR